MYDLLDRPVADLPAFERGVLMAVRRWVHAYTLAAGAERDDAGTDPFGAALRLIDRASSDDLPIGRPCQPLVGDSEAVLVGLWRLVAAGEPGATPCAALLVGSGDAAALVAAIDASLI